MKIGGILYSVHVDREISVLFLGEFVTLREGDNQFIVLADNPKQDEFNAACYHKDLEPFMARGHPRVKLVYFTD
ncbi:MAG TPA: hypothetical protein VK833_09845, partial [Gillisia sp.]|nr:hypothetical protein [Gillisia sp.]